MAKKTTAVQEYNHYHKDGTLWAKGQKQGDLMVGHWEFFRKDGTKLRSGSFANGEQIGEWITYDAAGKPYKTTVIKPKEAQATAAKVTPKKPKPAKQTAQTNTAKTKAK